VAASASRGAISNLGTVKEIPIKKFKTEKGGMNK
jgi:hypothetical protein